ncbi:MFS transporter [Actinokineospora enzanensis]|uniref:MFS transporter n=1 Tax=Actinokineospora enzanensis TaxID=155975 RepID=UPI00039AFC77|nr:MFS transporter [Actinokineospora enzanensis]
MTSESIASTHETAVPEESGAIRGKKAWALALLGTGLFLATLDFSIVYVALPSIGDGLALSEANLQWVVSGYAIFFAGFLLIGGRAGDRFGARRVFILATALFGISSLAAGLSDNFTLLVIARAVQGIGAGLLDPSTLGLIQRIFPAGPQRNRAMSVWGAVGAIGLVGGVVLGGLLASISWQWVFFATVPVAAIAVVSAFFLLPSDKDSPQGTGSLNVLSGVLGTGAILLLVLGLTRLADVGLTSTTAASFGGFVVLAVAWVIRERTSSNPLIARALLRTRSLVVACAVDACYALSVGVQFFVVTLFLQEQAGYSALAAGLGFLPLTVSVIVGNIIGDRFIGNRGPRAMIIVGLSTAAVGMILLALSTHLDGYLAGQLPGLLLSGLGNGIAFPAMFLYATSQVEPENQGVGAALITTTQYVFSALGLALLVIVLGVHPDLGDYTTAFAGIGALALLGAVIGAVAIRRPAAQPV